MNFYSDSERARHYIKEFLEDGQPHSIREIMDYVQEKTDGKRMNGETMQDSLINSAMHVLSLGEYENVKRGVYQKRYENNGATSVYNRAVAILENTSKELGKCFSLNIHDTTIPQGELMWLGHLGRQIRDFITQMKDMTVNERDGQSEAPSQESCEQQDSGMKMSL